MSRYRILIVTRLTFYTYFYRIDAGNNKTLSIKQHNTLSENQEYLISSSSSLSSQSAAHRTSWYTYNHVTVIWSKTTIHFYYFNNNNNIRNGTTRDDGSK